MKKLLFFFCYLSSITAFSQTLDTAKKVELWKKIYRPSTTKINDLVHTRLDVKFDFEKAWMYGKEWITLHPHFYPTDSLNLDAKGITFNEVSISKNGKRTPVKYSYDTSILHIALDRTYTASEDYVIYLDYIAKPDERALEPNSIVGAKGLYFINPRGTEKNKSTQIWTQGESEFNSAWMPTIDKPNQKSTQEIIMTVPAKYKTMSNGLLVSQKTNADGTRTDDWKMDLPNAPYLFFMGVGDYAVIKDSYKGKEVSYYVEKKYANLARRIFGLTPEMIAYYSKVTGVDFPWPKYVQIVGVDNESFSMENTSNTLHGDFIEQDARELADGNNSEETIAHELFHQWFGDYVTCESWANITLNESFADYSETLWREYKYGKDDGDGYNNREMRNYLSTPDDTAKNLVRFHYYDKDDVFDAVSYAKGGRILHMLRNYVGDSAFFKSLQLYLNTHKFKNGEAQDLRLAFEEITGQDMNWFWNQWYYSAGHPKLDIRYDYDASGKMVTVYMAQTQSGKAFTLPFAIDVYEGGNKKRYKVWMTRASDTFSFTAPSKPDLVNVDGDKILLCQKNDHKTLDEFIYQYKHAGLFVDRREALMVALTHQTETKALNFLKECLHDKSWRIKSTTLDGLNTKNDTIRVALESEILNIAKNDQMKTLKASAIEILGNFKKQEYKELFLSAVKDSSYTVAGKALMALSKIDSIGAVAFATKLYASPAKGQLEYAIVSNSDESNFDAIAERLRNLPLSNEQLFMIRPFGHLLGNIQNDEKVKKGVDILVKIRADIPQQYHSFSDPEINGALRDLMQKKQAVGLTEQAGYVKSKIPSESKSEEKQ
jgi:aminopeptidase N